MTVGVRKNVVFVSVAGSIGSLNVAVREEESETSDAPLTGAVVVTVGAPVPVPAPGEGPFLGPSQLKIPVERAAITSKKMTDGNMFAAEGLMQIASSE
ncbi:MAG: hypothetical protein NW202_14905 [Nitrospira sp.]|nr:hypothetical protein [Nitrospira sp.]